VTKKVPLRRDVVLEPLPLMIPISKKKRTMHKVRPLRKKSKRKNHLKANLLRRRKRLLLNLSPRRNKRRRKWKNSRLFWAHQPLPNHRQLKVRRKKRRRRLPRKKARLRVSPLRKLRRKLNP